MRAFKIYTTQNSMIIQAETMGKAIEYFEQQYDDAIIYCKDVEYIDWDLTIKPKKPKIYLKRK